MPETVCCASNPINSIWNDSFKYSLIHALMSFNATKLFAFSMHGTHTHTEWMQQVLSRPGWRIFYVPSYQHSNHELMNSNGVRISQNFKLNSTNVTMNLRHVKEWQLLTLNTTLHWNKRSKMCAWHKRSTRCGIQFGIHAVNFLRTFKAQKIHLYCILYWIHLLLRIMRWLTGLLIRILCKH